MSRSYPRWILFAGVTVAMGALLPLAADASPLAHRPPPLHQHHHRPDNLHARGTVGCGAVSVHAWGFLPGERVRVRELARVGWQRWVTADRHGELSITLTFPGRTGADVVTFVGSGAKPVATIGGNVTVSVPRIAVFRFNRC